MSLAPPLDGSPRLYANAREREREKNRRKRARRRARGLNAYGKPIVSPAIQAATLRALGHHPTDCPCHDCLFPSTTSYRPRVARFLGAH